MWWILWILRTKDSQPQSQVDLFNYWVYHQDSNICAFYYSDYVLHIDLTYFQLVKSYHSNSCLDIWTWGTDMKWQIHLININNSFLILILFTAHGFGLVEYLVFYPQECISLTMSCLLPPKNCSDWWKTLIITITNDFFWRSGVRKRAAVVKKIDGRGVNLVKLHDVIERDCLYETKQDAQWI